MFRSLTAVIALFVTVTGAWAEDRPLQGENLLQAMPEGYKLASSGRNGSVLTDEMIPKSEQLDQWSEMLTTQIYMGGIHQSGPKGFYQRFASAWQRACPAASGKLIESGTENGYPFAFWMQGCPENPGTGRPEYTWYKAIEGNDSFYLIQKSWRYPPAPDEIRRWTRYLGTIAVCDSRIAAQSCAALVH